MRVLNTKFLQKFNRLLVEVFFKSKLIGFTVKEMIKVSYRLEASKIIFIHSKLFDFQSSCLIIKI